MILICCCCAMLDKSSVTFTNFFPAYSYEIRHVPSYYTDDTSPFRGGFIAMCMTLDLNYRHVPDLLINRDGTMIHIRV